MIILLTLVLSIIFGDSEKLNSDQQIGIALLGLIELFSELLITSRLLNIYLG